MNNQIINHRLILIAERMLQDQADLIEGCREIVSLSQKTSNPMNEIFFCFRAIDSDTDHFPLGKVREQCAETYLIEADKEKADYLDEETCLALKGSCRELIRELSR